MWSFLSGILPILLQAASYFFDNAKDKKKIAEIIMQWMIVMAKKFLASADTKADFARMWKESGAETILKETK